MRGFIDLHSHWVFGVDDGARTADDSAELVRALHGAGFDHVVATPHMRPGMFDNTRERLVGAFERTVRELEARAREASLTLPRLSLASEHFFDDEVFERILAGKGLPYPGEHAVLVEFSARQLPAYASHRFYDLRRRRLRPVVAHPERYEPVWADRAVLEPLLDRGAVLLLDVAALAGKYGRAPRRAAEELLDEGLYYAACSDAHGARDVPEVVKGIARLEALVGAEEARFLLVDGPTHILEGRVEE